MKSIFRNLKSLALVALVGVAAMAVSCEPTPDPTPTPGPSEGTTEAYEFVGGENAYFEAGETKTVAVKEGQSVEGATVEAPEGWTVAATAEGLAITAPTAESVTDATAEAYGKVEVKLEVEDTTYEGTLNVFMGEIVEVEMVSNSFKDIEVKVVIAGIDSYLVHLGTDAAWQGAFDEWQNTQGSWNPMDFGWAGEYYGLFEGSLFTFAKNPYKMNYQPVPGTKYQLAILPLVEGKAVADYTYNDIRLYDLETVAAGKNGSVTPALSLESRSHAQVMVKVDATGAYMTYYEFYSQKDYEEIGADNFEKVIKSDVIKRDFSTEPVFTAKEDGLDENETVYFAAMSIDENGNYGELALQEFTSDIFKFNENIKVTIGEITCNDEGKKVFVPVSVEGGEVDHYRCSYVTNENEWGFQRYGGSVEKAEIVIATANNEYSGPKFYYPEGVEKYDANGNRMKNIEDGKIVISQGPYPGAKARILVLVIDKDGMPSHAAYAEFTPTDTSKPIINANEEGYEYGMPTVTYKSVTKGKKGDVTIYTVDFNVTLDEHTDTAWVAVAAQDYTVGYTAYELLTAMMAGRFQYAKEFVADGVFNADIMYAQNYEDRTSAAFVAWKDDNGNYHETKLMPEPVAAAQDDVNKALAEMDKEQ